MLLGWPAAILMQLAHPLVLAGVLDHSVAVAQPRRRLERLHSTIESMLLLTFGSEQDVQRTADKINRIHDYVHGRLERPAGRFAAGTGYSAHDPVLLRWVHATLIDVLPRTYELLVGPLSPQEKDTYCAEATELGPLLHMPDSYLPVTMEELETYMNGVYASGAIEVTDEARALAAELLAPPWPLPKWRLLCWPNADLTILLLPPGLRQAYGFGWGRGQQARSRLTAGLIRRVLPLLPPLLRHWPASRRT